jgi:hypothetical protein
LLIQVLLPVTPAVPTRDEQLYLIDNYSIYYYLFVSCLALTSSSTARLLDTISGMRNFEISLMDPLFYLLLFICLLPCQALP